MDRPTCKTCPFWDSANWHNLENGRCRRAPPVGDGHDVEGTDELLGSWPLTAQDDWCGEHPKFRAYITAMRYPGESVLSRPIDDLGLPVKVRWIFDSERINTIGDLVRQTSDDLLCYRNFGQVSLKAVRKRLARMGLYLRDDLVRAES